MKPTLFVLGIIALVTVLSCLLGIWFVMHALQWMFPTFDRQALLLPSTLLAISGLFATIGLIIGFVAYRPPQFTLDEEEDDDDLDLERVEILYADRPARKSSPSKRRHRRK